MAVRNITRFPIDTGRLGALRCAGVAQVVANRETGELRMDRDTGHPVWNVTVFSLDPATSQVQALEMKVPAEKEPPVTGKLVSFSDAVVSYYDIEGNTGVSVRASRVVAQSETAGRE